MLILAGIAISFIIGNNGLFKKAKTAIDIHKKTAVQEELQLAADNGYADIHSKNAIKVANDMEKDCKGIEWVYKNSLAGKYKGYDFTVINEEVIVKEKISKDNMNFMINGASDKSYFWSDDYKQKILSINIIKDNLNNYINNSDYIITWDVSNKKNNSIIACLKNSSTSGKYDLDIVSNKIIELPEDSSSIFAFENLTNINGLNNISTANVIKMNSMFLSTKLTTLDLEDNFDTFNVTDMSYMFASCKNLTSLNLKDKFNTSNVTTMEGMFNGCLEIVKINLESNFDTSNVTNMYSMFNDCRKITSLNLG